MRSNLQNARHSLMDAIDELRGMLMELPQQYEHAARRATLQVACENAQSARRLLEFCIVMDAQRLDQSEPVKVAPRPPRPVKRRAR
jgi:hypothetical protein